MNQISYMITVQIPCAYAITYKEHNYMGLSRHFARSGITNWKFQLDNMS